MIDAWTYSIVLRCREGLEEDREKGEGKRTMPYMSREELERAVVKLADRLDTLAKRAVVPEPAQTPTLTIEVRLIYP